ncbi:MAG: hypothetical protein R2852_03900 [Bacteroidia bacterium]
MALKHGKNKWLFAILSIGVYYAATLLTGVVIGILNAAYGDGSLLEEHTVMLTLIALPIGLLTVWLFYKMLKRSWENKDLIEDSDIIDAEIIE